MYISLVPGKRQITFQPTDFLLEAIEEFLESGTKTPKIGSCVIKIAVATELLLKEKLEKICPALVLEKIDEGALQVAKLYQLGNKMLNPKELDNVEVKTVSFTRLLGRAGKFFDISAAIPHLVELQNIRNELVHHRGRVDVTRVNLLLIEKIFPFLEEFTEELRLKAGTWKRLKSIAKSNADVASTEIAKKVEHFAVLADRLSTRRISLLLGAPSETKEQEEVVVESLQCPACKQPSATVFSSWDVDVDESGQPVAGWIVFTMRCKVCGLELEQGEIERVIANFENFFPNGHEDERDKWEVAIVEPDYSDVDF